jgi:hypothetical protein
MRASSRLSPRPPRGGDTDRVDHASDRGAPRLVAVAENQQRRYGTRRGEDRHGEHQRDSSSYQFPPVISKRCEPVETLPLMSSASHLNVVDWVRWNTWPGSRGPVESQSGDWLVGCEPSIV